MKNKYELKRKEKKKVLYNIQADSAGKPGKNTGPISRVCSEFLKNYLYGTKALVKLKVVKEVG